MQIYYGDLNLKLAECALRDRYRSDETEEARRILERRRRGFGPSAAHSVEFAGTVRAVHGAVEAQRIDS